MVIFNLIGPCLFILDRMGRGVLLIQKIGFPFFPLIFLFDDQKTLPYFSWVPHWAAGDVSSGAGKPHSVKSGFLISSLSWCLVRHLKRSLSRIQSCKFRLKKSFFKRHFILSFS